MSLLCRGNQSTEWTGAVLEGPSIIEELNGRLVRLFRTSSRTVLRAGDNRVHPERLKKLAVGRPKVWLGGRERQAKWGDERRRRDATTWQPLALLLLGCVSERRSNLQRDIDKLRSPEFRFQALVPCSFSRSRSHRDWRNSLLHFVVVTAPRKLTKYFMQ